MNFLLFLSPSSLVLNLAWASFVNLFAATMIAGALILPMVIELRATWTTAPATRLVGLLEHCKHLLLTTVPLAIANWLFVFTFLGIVLAAFVVIRFALVAPAAVVEDEDMTDSLSRSWELTQGSALRTGKVLLGAAAPFMVATLVLEWLPLSDLVMLAGTVVAESLVIPFVLIVVLLMFEDYRSLEAEPEDFGPANSPPTTSL